jgi:hypothetical protein
MEHKAINDALLARSKKLKINFNLPVYNLKTGMYEDADGKYRTFAEARQKQWRCDKCDQMFPNYILLKDHKTDFHSY